MNNPASFSSLPTEIQHIIFSGFTQGLLTKCALVCKEWNQLCTPLVWQTLIIKTDMKEKSFMDHAQQVFVDNAHNVQHLSVSLAHKKSILFTVLPLDSSTRDCLCTNLRSLDVDDIVYRALPEPHLTSTFQDEWSAMNSLYRLVECNRKLTKLGLHSSIRGSILWDLTTKLVPQLETLDLSVRIPIRAAKEILESLPGTIKDVTINVLNWEEEAQQEQEREQQQQELRTFLTNLMSRCAALPDGEHQEGSTEEEEPNEVSMDGEQQEMGQEDEDEDQGDEEQDEDQEDWDQDTEPRTSKPHPLIESLHLNGNFEGSEEYLLLPFLDSCGSNFSTFKTNGSNKTFFREKTNAALTRLGIFRKSFILFDLPGRGGSTDAEIARWILLNPRLEKMDLTQLDQAGPLTQGAILSTCEHYLQEIHFDTDCGYSSKPLQALLCRASNLQKLATYISVWNENLFIYGTDMIESPWATTVLRSFRCPINVPRSYDIKEGGERIYSVDGPEVERSREIQRKVLQHLGAQTELEELHLGYNMDSYDAYQPIHEDDIPEYQWNSLELTLAGGLDELAGLKKLRMLGVDLTVHGIGVPELEWMKANWPSLHWIGGLHDGYHPLDPAVEQWLETTNHDWYVGAKIVVRRD